MLAEGKWLGIANAGGTLTPAAARGNGTGPGPARSPSYRRTNSLSALPDSPAPIARRTRGHAVSIAFACAVLAATASACAPGDGVRIVVERDTVALYGATSSRLPVRIASANGDPIAMRRKYVRLSSDSAVRHGDAGLSCARAGHADVTITVGDAIASLVARCRPTRTFHATFGHYLTIGDPPRRLDFEAELPSGEREPVEPLDLWSSDTLVARVEDGALLPVAVGRATLGADLGGVRSWARIVVSEDIVRDTITLAPGEFRSWPLRSGRYEFTVRPVTPGTDRRTLEMVTEGVRCTPNTKDEHTIDCFVRDTGAVAMRNLDARPDGAPKVAAVRILRTP